MCFNKDFLVEFTTKGAAFKGEEGSGQDGSWRAQYEETTRMAKEI
jgi:hypothetical protein